jgi:hypothetical protein
VAVPVDDEEVDVGSLLAVVEVEVVDIESLVDDEVVAVLDDDDACVVSAVVAADSEAVVPPGLPQASRRASGRVRSVQDISPR